MLNKEYIVSNIALKETRQGKPYMTLLLTPLDDKNSPVAAKLWSEALEKLRGGFKNNDVIKVVDGKLDSYNNSPQIVINDLNVVKTLQWGYSIEDSKDLFYSLLDFIDKNLKNPVLKELTLKTLQKYSEISFFFLSPAAKSHHHNYPGGLLKHTMELCKISLALKETELYLDVDWEIVFSACVLHDLGKIYDYKIENDVIETTDTLKLTGHIVSTPLVIYETAKELDLEKTACFDNLLHAVIAHHGQKEYGSPQTPQTKEAWAVHLVDMISSRLAG